MSSINRSLAWVLCAALSTTQCATGTRALSSTAVAQPGATRANTSAVRTAAAAIPPGSRIQLGLADGVRVKATLLAVEEEWVVVAPRTRIPESPQRIPLDRILAIERDTGIGGGKAIAIGAAIGAAATIGVLMIFAAILAGD